MKISHNSLPVILAIISIAFVASPGRSQTDSISLQTESHVNVLLSGGITTDFAGSGGVLDLSVLYEKNVFAIGFSSEGIGNVVTYRQGGTMLDFFTPRGETSYAADLKQVFSVEYGSRLRPAIAVTAGLAWVMHAQRMAINGHQDSGGFFTTGDYHATLVEHENDYLAVPLTLKAYLRFGSWIGMEFHEQVLVSLEEIRCNTGICLSFGDLPD